MTALIALILATAAIWGCVAWIRHMKQQDRPTCRHQRIRVPDGELDVCECGKDMR